MADAEQEQANADAADLSHVLNGRFESVQSDTESQTPLPPCADVCLHDIV